MQSADAPRWTGGGNGVWSNAAQTPDNWQLILAGIGTDYIPGEEVLFDNTAANKIVSLSVENVSPQ